MDASPREVECRAFPRARLRQVPAMAEPVTLADLIAQNAELSAKFMALEERLEEQEGRGSGGAPHATRTELRLLSASGMRDRGSSSMPDCPPCRPRLRP